MVKLKDSGTRKEFSTGAVRDISEGKGRCDLLPLDVVDNVIKYKETYWDGAKEDILYGDNIPQIIIPYPTKRTVLDSLDLYFFDGDPGHMFDAVCRFIDDAFGHDIFSAMIELSKHYEDGAKKYSDNNWKLGIDLHCFVDSAIRHYLKYRRGDTDEPHDRAVLWNLVGAIWTHEHKPELNDIHPEQSKGEVPCGDEN